MAKTLLDRAVELERIGGIIHVQKFEICWDMCPYTYGLADKPEKPCADISCEDCWNREYIPEGKE